MKKILLLTFLIIAIPFFIVGVKDSNKIITKLKYGIISNKKVRVKQVSNNEIIEVPLEDYVLGVVAGEMPATFDIEALKAQSVASRTYVLRKMENKTSQYDVDDSTNNQVYLTLNEIKQKWKENYNSNIEKIKLAINSTKGEVILYENKIIDAMFFSTSNGYTENSEEVFSSNEPYLVSVDSHWDETESPVFNTSNIISKREFLFNLGLEYNNDIKLEDIAYTNTGRVKTIKVNGKNFKSSEIRKIFNLKSTSFDIKIDKDNVNFFVKGYGHGVGMSQYGANGMAKNGFNYKQILNHYYKNCEIKKIN